MKTIKPFSCLVWCLILGGCFSVPSQPKPQSVDPKLPVTKYDKDTFASDLQTYRDLMKAGRISEATQQRDGMIQRIRVEIDAWYGQLEEDLYQQRASFNTWADVFELGLAGATGITNGARGKTVLAAILSAEKGSRLSYDKNWFREKTTEVLINAMRSERDKWLAEINGKMSVCRADKYSFEEAWADLLLYFRAGTPEGGLLALTASSGQQAAEAKTAIQDQNQERIDAIRGASAASIKNMKGLTKQLKGMPEAQALAIIHDLNLTAPANATTPELINVIRDYLDKLEPNDAEGFKRTSDAFSKSKGTP